MATVHRNLTGADLHEPKGADTALSGQVYVSNGAGSGSWVDASSIITNVAFTTGDVKVTLKNTADTGWILGAAGTIGDGSSSATIRANADTSALFQLIWNNWIDTYAPVSGGRGASAAADFAAHKRITLPDMWGRAMGIAGQGTGLTNRPYGIPVGTETHTIATTNLPPYTPSGTVSQALTVAFNGANLSSVGGGGNSITTGGFSATGTAPLNAATVGGTLTFTGAAQGGASTPISNMQPTHFFNIMIKL